MTDRQMIVLHITSVEFNARGKRNWLLFEVEVDADQDGMKQVVDRLNTGELIYGSALYVQPDETGEEPAGTRIVTASNPVTLTRDEVHRMQKPWWKLVRYEDADHEAAQ